MWPVKIEKTVFQGDFSQVHLCWGDQRLVARYAAMEPIAAGRDVYLAVEPRRVVLLGAENYLEKMSVLIQKANVVWLDRVTGPETIILRPITLLR